MVRWNTSSGSHSAPGPPRCACHPCATSLAVTYPDPEPQQLRFQLRATMSAPRQARQAVTQAGLLANRPYLEFLIQLLAAELASNVLRHTGLTAGEQFELVIDHDDQTVRVEVIDPGPGFNPLLLLREHAINGSKHRGLALIDALADRWGFLNHDHTCHVWFEIDLTAERRPWYGRQPLPRSPTRS